MEQNLNAEPEITATTQPEETRSMFSFANIYGSSDKSCDFIIMQIEKS